MADRGDIKAGGAFIDLFLKDTQLVKGLRSAAKTLQSFGASVASFGGNITSLGDKIVNPLRDAVLHFTSAGGAIDDMSGRTGVARTELAQLGYAAKQGGTDLETVEKALREMQDKGISAARFDELAADIAAIEDPTQRANRAMELWGKRNGTALLPMIANLQELKAEARDMGIGLNEEDYINADKLGDAIGKIKEQWNQTLFNAAAALAPMLLDAANVIAGVVKSTTRWISENQSVVRTVALIGGALVALGTTIAVIGGGISALGTVLGGIATVLAFALSPVGLIVVAVTAIVAGLAAAVYWWTNFTTSGKAAFAALMAALKPFADTLQTAFGGITKALAAGDIELAWKILTTALTLEWFRFIDAIVGKFVEMVKIVADNELVRGVLGEALSGKIDDTIKAGKGFTRGSVVALTAELAALKAKADALAAGREKERKKEGGGAGEDEPAGASDRRVLTAHSANAAFALTFGGASGNSSRADLVTELKHINKSIRDGSKGEEAHRREVIHLLRSMGRFGP